MLAFNKNTMNAYQSRAIGATLAFLSQYHRCEYGNSLRQETLDELREYISDRVCEGEWYMI
jgi:hypothetical protein